jgi:hypothetical protein
LQRRLGRRVPTSAWAREGITLSSALDFPSGRASCQVHIRAPLSDSNLNNHVQLVLGWFSLFTISQKRQWVIRESFVDASTYLSETKAEREEVSNVGGE